MLIKFERSIYVNLQKIYIFVEYLKSVNEISILVRIILAIICGGVIGAEREKSHQPAGLRTYTLVCMGAAMVMLTGEYMHEYYNTGDPARLGAQVISGIGFLGAGSIIVSRETKIRGLTTAAGLWVSACIGLAVGAGFYSGGILATAAVYLIIAKLKKVHFQMNDTLGLYAELSSDIVIHNVIQNLEELDMEIHEISLENGRTGIKKLILSFKVKEEFDKKEFIGKIQSMDGLKYSKFLM